MSRRSTLKSLAGDTLTVNDVLFTFGTDIPITGRWNTTAENVQAVVNANPKLIDLGVAIRAKATRRGIEISARS